MILHRAGDTDVVCSILSGSGRVLVADFLEMLGRYPPSVNLEDSGDDSDELVESPDDPQIEKIKALSDTQLDDEITKYKVIATGNLKLPDGGDKVRSRLQKLEQVQSARAKKRSPMVRLCRGVFSSCTCASCTINGQSFCMLKHCQKRILV